MDDLVYVISPSPSSRANLPAVEDTKPTIPWPWTSLIPKRADFTHGVSAVFSEHLRNQADEYSTSPRAPDARVPNSSDLQHYASAANFQAMLCCNCQSTTHKVKDCLSAPNGSIEACLFCHNSIHNVDDCESFQELTVSQMIAMLVKDRSNMPPFRTTISWYDYLWKWRDETNERDADGNVRMLDAFLWSEQFSKEHAPNVKRLQEILDTEHRYDHLPADPSTRTWDDVRVLFNDQEDVDVMQGV